VLLNQRVRNANSSGDFARHFGSGVLNEKNILDFVRDFSPVVRLLAGIRADCEFIACADSFKYESGYSRRCRGAAAASAISH
jgi:hypothetical protein